MAERSTERARGVVSGWTCAALLTLAACAPGMAGVWSSPDGLGSLEFRARGRVYVTFGDSTYAGEYELDGNRVIIEGPGGAHVCTLQDDEIEGFGMTFEKRSSEHVR